MHRVKRTGNYASLPAPPSGGTPGYFGPGDPGTATPATIPGYDWFNSTQEEIVAPILAAGLTLSDSNNGQLLAALNAGWGMSKSLNNPGWTLLPGGLILQWGVSASGGSSSPTVTYPIAFPSAVLARFAMNTDSNVGAAMADSIVVTIYGVGDKTFFGCIGTNANTNVLASPSEFSWLAIGY